MESIESLIEHLPDPLAAQRFSDEFAEKYPAKFRHIAHNSALFSDVLALASFSPLLATTILQNPEYTVWLERQRKLSGVRTKEELFESLAQFALTNSSLDSNIMLARFRRRELIRIYLKDIRRLGTIAEITEEISNLADVILEYAYQIARQELDNRYGMPLENDEKSRAVRAQFCIVALGKLGSRELNYSSDIDLVFIYSNNGTTAGTGSRDACSNKQYFVKLAEHISKIVGGPSGEGAAYRVDTRLRPYGSVGALASSLEEICRYYETNARTWEKQVLIRSRVSAGDSFVFDEFNQKVLPLVYSKDETVLEALENVRRSKEKIDSEYTVDSGFDVKLGKGGIREIEFIAQALQLAFGGTDSWLRAPHTLISLSRLADRGLVLEQELTSLFEGYYFLRRLEHHLQMAHGLQTHTVPADIDGLQLISRKMGYNETDMFSARLIELTENVHAAFTRIFGKNANESAYKSNADKPEHRVSEPVAGADISPIIDSIERSATKTKLDKTKVSDLELFAETAPPFAERLASNPVLVARLPKQTDEFISPNYLEEFRKTVECEEDYSGQIAAMRRVHASFITNLIAFDIFETIHLKALKAEQTKLAEASIITALSVTSQKLSTEFSTDLPEKSLGVLGLGKLGGGAMDYNSDLDLVLVFNDALSPPNPNTTNAQYFARAAETFVNTLSSMTRDGAMYRVDLRLRPDGKNGATAIGFDALYQYLETRAAIWELLAYVKVRGISAREVEVAANVREKIHRRALREAPKTLRFETRRIRDLLEHEKSGIRRGKEIDIKYGEGGLQDVYFTVRYLQLRDNITDSLTNRATEFTLNLLKENGSLSMAQFIALSEGYRFLSLLDHQIRLVVGRSTILPLSKKNSLEVIAKRMKLSKHEDLLAELTAHRISIHQVFEEITLDSD
ncbi:MAG: hypothetical protein ACK5NT_11275 [Pyrinomonadaceae bacterium]